MKRLVKSHFIKAEKPFEVFTYVSEGPFLQAGQLIGNIINIYQDDEKEGKVSYDHVPVFRNPDKRWMLDSDHAFVGYHDIMESDILPLGFEGDQVGLKAINIMRGIDYHSGDNGHDPKDIFAYFDSTGLKYDTLADEIAKGNADGEFKDMKARIEHRHENNGYRTWDEYYLEINEGIAMFVQLDNGATTEPVVDLARQMRDWRELGVEWPTIVVRDEYYEYQILELAMCAEMMATHMIEHGTKCIEDVYRLRVQAGCNRVTIETIYSVASDALPFGGKTAQERADEVIVRAVGEGLLTVDNDCVTFSDEIGRMAEWKFSPKSDE
jgi:hypothetical protein